MGSYKSSVSSCVPCIFSYTMDVASLLQEWGLPPIVADCFAASELDSIEALRTLDEKTARNVLTPAGFQKFWKIFCERKSELEVPDNTEEPALKRRRIVDSDFEVSDDDDDGDSLQRSEQHDLLVKELKTLFQSSFIGETLLNQTEEFTDTERNRVAEIIICEELRKTKPIGHIPRSKFIKLSKAIVALFPNEERETFYIPYHKVQNIVFAAKGKLHNQYHYWRSVGVSTNLVQPLRSKNSSITSVSLSVTPEDVKVSLKWLNVNLGPKPIVEQHWSSTFSHRMDLLDVNKKPVITVSQYYSKFPVLRQPWAYSLLLDDFKTLHPDKVDKFNEKWDSFAVNLVEKLKKVKAFDTSVIDKLTELLNENHGVSVCHIFLQYFAYIFPPQVVLRGRKPNNWTANRSEMQNGFFLHVVSEAALKEFIGKKVARLKSYKKPLSFNPFPALIGKDLHSIEKCFVVIQPSEMYLVDSPVEAFDAAFKAIIALCCEYPPECKYMWLVIQKSLYGIDTIWDQLSPPIVPILKHFSK